MLKIQDLLYCCHVVIVVLLLLSMLLLLPSSSSLDQISAVPVSLYATWEGVCLEDVQFNIETFWSFTFF